MLNDVMIDPNTGRVWKTWHRLYEYVVSKYSVLNYHSKKSSDYNNESKRQWTNKRQENSSKRVRFEDRRVRLEVKRNYNHRRDRRDDSKKHHGDKRDGRSRDSRDSRSSRDSRDHREARDDKSDLKTTDWRKLVVGQRLSDAQREELNKQKRCFRCFKTGHEKRDCRVKSSSSRDERR